MNVRFAISTDKSQVLSLLDQLGEEINLKWGFSPHNAEATKVGGPIFDEIIARADTMIFVAEDATKLVGLATFYLLPNTRHGFHRGHVEDMIVDKDSRGKGIGSALLGAIKEYCKSHNISVVKLDSGLELVDAHRFYEKNGGKFTEKMFRFDL